MIILKYIVELKIEKTMKNFFVLLVLTFLSITTFAQKDSLKVAIGFNFAPAGGISLKNAKVGFKQNSSLLFVTSFNKGKWTVLPLYSFLTNSAGAAFVYSFHPKVGNYLFCTKAVLNNGSYLGYGIFTPVAKGRANAFVEFGSGWHQWDPGLYMGMFIPFTLEVKKKQK